MAFLSFQFAFQNISEDRFVSNDLIIDYFAKNIHFFLEIHIAINVNTDIRGHRIGNVRVPSRSLSLQLHQLHLILNINTHRQEILVDKKDIHHKNKNTDNFLDKIKM